MSDETNEKPVGDELPEIETADHSHPEVSDLENLMDDTFDEIEPDEDLMPLEKAEEKDTETTTTTDEIPELSRTTREIMEIIAQNELIEKAKQDRIKSIIKKQEKVLSKKEGNLDKLLTDQDLLTKKRKLAKKAMKKAKELKLGSDKIGLIKLDLQQTTELLANCKNLVEQEKADIDNIKSLIDLLETTL